MHIRYYLFYQGKGGAQQNISLTVLKNTPFVKPPKQVQEKMVQVIESLLSTSRIANRNINKSRQLLAKFRQAILSAAISGRLTEEWRNGNRIIETVNIREEAPEEFEEVELPIKWIWTKLGYLADIRGGVTKGRNLSGKKTIWMPYLRVANVQDGFLDLSEIKKIEIPIDEKEKYLLKEKDILFTEGGDRDKLGRGTIWEGQIEECIHQNHIFRARVSNSEIIPEYLSLYTKSAFAKLHFFNNASQTVNLASINMTTLKNTPICLPPYEEQKEIIQRVKTYMDSADKVERQIASASKRAEKLTQAILAKAFRGELVS